MEERQGRVPRMIAFPWRLHAVGELPAPAMNTRHSLHVYYVVFQCECMRICLTFSRLACVDGVEGLALLDKASANTRSLSAL